jgi:hypothetical protein
MRFKPFSHISCLAIMLAAQLSASAQTPDYDEGWYQIKRTVNLASLADVDFSSLSSLTAVTSLLSDVSYLTTADEFTSTITIPVVNINMGTAVYGARLLDVDGLKDYTADLTSAQGRNVNERELSTYYYLTPVGTDDDGSWRYTVRSANGHYMGPDGRYYVEPKGSTSIPRSAYRLASRSTRRSARSCRNSASASAQNNTRFRPRSSTRFPMWTASRAMPSSRRSSKSSATWA